MTTALVIGIIITLAIAGWIFATTLTTGLAQIEIDKGEGRPHHE